MSIVPYQKDKKENTHNILTDDVICSKSEFYQDILNFMEHPQSRAFYSKYMTNPTHMNQIAYYLYLYDKIDKAKVKASPHGKIKLLEEITERYEKQHKLE